MPSQTFENLNQVKKERVTAALLNEFSHHPLADAQVARIVKDAGIARGSFYKYFADLTDSYHYLFRHSMTQFHTANELRGQVDKTPADYVDQVRQLLAASDQHGFYELLRLHYTANEAYLQQHQTVAVPPAPKPNFPPLTWAVMTLTHQAVKDCLLDPDGQDQILERLDVVLTKLMGDHDVSSN